LRSDWTGKIVVDATTAIEFPSFKSLDLGGQPSTHVVAEQFKGARVVKAFNTLPAAALRLSLEIPPTYVARPLTVARLVVCAAPGYLKRHGTPRTPQDLAEHNCLTLPVEGSRVAGRSRVRTVSLPFAFAGTFVPTVMIYCAVPRLQHKGSFCCRPSSLAVILRAATWCRYCRNGDHHIPTP
jgi:hypothetical protein